MVMLRVREESAPAAQRRTPAPAVSVAPATETAAAPTPPAAAAELTRTPRDEGEALRTLVGLAHRKTGAIPGEILARHAIAVTAGGDWPVQRAALEAMLRRIALRDQDGLDVATRPPGGRAFGDWTTRSQGGGRRPYASRLHALDPLRGSCDCDDFLRNSLGWCKHLAAVLEDLASDAARFAKARRESLRSVPRLAWDPVRALSGPGDWLDGVRYVAPHAAHGHPGSPAPAAMRWFSPAGGSAVRGGGGMFVLRGRRARSAAERARVVDALTRLGGLGARAPGGVETDPALAVLLREERERLRVRAARAKDLPRRVRALSTLKQRLYPYQTEGVVRFLRSGALVLADDMGLGKTAQAVAACHALWRTKEVRRGLLVVPASLKAQWLREWALFTDAPCAVVDGGPVERAEAYRTTRTGFLIANYEQVLRDLEVMHAWRPDLVVLDEAQRIKNWATKTAAYVKRLEPRWRLVLTGTPMENRLQELSSLLDWVDDRALEPIWRLVPWHSVVSDGDREVVGARNLDTLRERLSGCMLRRVRQDVLKQLPPRTDTRVPVEITEEQFEEHERLKKPIAQLMAIATRRPLTQAQFLKLMSLFTTQRIISNGMAQLRFEERWPDIARVRRPDDAFLKGLSSPKLAEFREIVSQVALGQGRKTVVFSQWRRMLALSHWSVAGLLEDAGLRAAFFTGAESQKQRTRNIVDFHDDPTVRILFATDAGGVGLNLQRAASCVVNLDLPWNPAVLEQRIGRIYRLGQTKPIDAYALVTQDSIEARIANLVGDKRALFKGLFDGDTDEVRFDGSGSFFGGLQKLVSPVATPDLTSPPDGAAPIDAPADADVDDVVAAADETGQGVDSSPPAASGGTTETASRVVAAVAATSPDDVRRLFSRLSIRAAEDGGVRIEAPADAASALAALFEGMASLLRTASPRS